MSDRDAVHRPTRVEFGAPPDNDRLIVTDADGDRIRMRLSDSRYAFAELDVEEVHAAGTGDEERRWRPVLMFDRAGLDAVQAHAAMLLLSDAVGDIVTSLLVPPSVIRPHVPDVDRGGDPRLHLIVDGVAACGVPVTVPGRLGTHNPAESDCPDCAATLSREGDDAGLPADNAEASRG